LVSRASGRGHEHRGACRAGLTPLFPYLLVNIGSGVSMIKVDGPGRFERVSGTNLGGGTFWGLCRLLTRVRSFDEMLALSSTGNSANVDMLVGDIYGGRDYENIGLSADTIASSFGKVVSLDKELEDYSPAGAAAVAWVACAVVGAS
jgi:pantothenate kinase